MPEGERSRRYALQLVWRALSQHDLGLAGAGADMALSLSILESRWPAQLNTSRVKVLSAWMAARADAAGPDALLKFDDAARAYAAIQPPQHLAQLQLALLRADLQRHRADSAEARAQWTAATQAWERFAGRRWQPPVSVLD